jgi:uncharacterized protein YqfA (UPF0365 family)
MAIARQQEMRVKFAESQAKLMLAECETLAALAHAFREGLLRDNRLPIHYGNLVGDN